MTDYCPHSVWWIYDFALIGRPHGQFRSEPTQMSCSECGVIRDATDDERREYGSEPKENDEDNLLHR